MKSTRKIETSLDLRNELIEVFGQLRQKKIPHATAVALVNTAGKIMDTVKAELLYAALTKERPTGTFLAHSTQPRSAVIAIENGKSQKRIT